MGKVLVRDKRTGMLISVDERDLARYMANRDKPVRWTKEMQAAKELLVSRMFGVKR